MRLLKKIFGRVRVRILAVILLVSCFTGIAVATASFYMARSSIKNQVINNLKSITVDTQEIITNLWLPILSNQMETVASVAGGLYQGNTNIEDIRRGLIDANARMPGFKRLSVYLSNGSLLVSSDPDYTTGHHDELAGLVAGETVIIPFGVDDDLPDQEEVITFAAPVVLGSVVVAVLQGI